MPPTPIIVRALADLGPDSALHAHCGTCRHAIELDVPGLVARYGNLSFEALRGRLRCRRCGRREVELIHGWSRSRPGPPAEGQR